MVKNVVVFYRRTIRLFFLLCRRYRSMCFFLQNCSIGESRSSNEPSGSNDGAKGRASGLYVWARIFNLIFFLLLLQHVFFRQMSCNIIYLPQATEDTKHQPCMPQADRRCRLD